MPADDNTNETPHHGPQSPTPASRSTDDAPPGDTPAVDRRVLEILVCPLTKTTLEYNAATCELISRAAGLAFPIRNGVPLMIADAARNLTDDDLDRKPGRPAK